MKKSTQRIIPPSILPVIILSGTPYEMGSQYGEQAKKYIRIVADSMKGKLLLHFENNWNTALHCFQQYENMIRQEVPYMIEIFQGMADSSGLGYEEIIMINCVYDIIQPSHEQNCTCISAYGRATKNGQTIGGGNLDFDWDPCSYQVLLIVYSSKESGLNSYISAVTAGWMALNSLNDKGLVLLGNGSEAARPQDRGIGVPWPIIASYIPLSCSDVNEAKEAVFKFPRTAGMNWHFVDGSGQSAVVECTAALAAARKPGDNDEDCYLVTTNHYILPEMEPAKPPDPYWSSLYRYWTATKYLKDGHGNLDPHAFMSILSSRDYWDGERWHPNDPKGSINRFEARPAGTLSTSIFVPDENTGHFSCGDPRSSWGSGAPFTTGEYVKLVLEKEPYTLTLRAEETAVENLWRADQAIYQSFQTEANYRYNLAKRAYWEGLAYKREAILDESMGKKKEALNHYGRAVTSFCRAQAYALLALNLH